jgi:hypothetical protein
LGFNLVRGGEDNLLGDLDFGGGLGLSSRIFMEFPKFVTNFSKCGFNLERGGEDDLLCDLDFGRALGISSCILME